MLWFPEALTDDGPAPPPRIPLAADAAAVLFCFERVLETIGVAEDAACWRIDPGTEEVAEPVPVLAAMVAAWVEALCVAGLK